jgi:hypothetical protein
MFLMGKVLKIGTQTAFPGYFFDRFPKVCFKSFKMVSLLGTTIEPPSTFHNSNAFLFESMAVLMIIVTMYNIAFLFFTLHVAFFTGYDTRVCGGYFSSLKNTKNGVFGV